MYAKCLTTHQLLTVMASCRLLEGVDIEGMWDVGPIVKGSVYPQRPATPALLSMGSGRHGIGRESCAIIGDLVSASFVKILVTS